MVVKLAPFSEAVLQHFIHLERPEGSTEPDGAGFEPDFHFKPKVELYNLIEDPHEDRNVAGHHPDVVATLGDARRPAWKWSEKPGEPPASREHLLTHDPARYADELWWRQQRPDLVMGPGSWGWVERASASMRSLLRPGVLEAVAVPTLMLAAREDKLVAYRAIADAAVRLPNVELVTFGPEARHEILRESDAVRTRAMTSIDAFLDRISG